MKLTVKFYSLYASFRVDARVDLSTQNEQIKTCMCKSPMLTQGLLKPKRRKTSPGFIDTLHMACRSVYILDRNSIIYKLERNYVITSLSGI